MVVVCFFGTKLTGWMLTWGVLKPGRLPTSSSSASKNVSPCVRPACFWPTSPLGVGTWSRALGPRAAQVPSPQLLLLGTAPLRDCSLARAAADPMSPLGMPLLSLDPVLRGETTAPGLGVREQLPVVGPPSRDPCGGTLPGMGKRAEFLTEFLPIAGCSLGQPPRDRLLRGWQRSLREGKYFKCSLSFLSSFVSSSSLLSSLPLMSPFK